MRRSYVAGVIAASSLVAATACSLVTSLEGLSTTVVVVEREGGDDGAIPVADAASPPPTDAPQDALAIDSSDAAPPNLHPQGTFEGVATCAPWSAYQGSHSVTEVARTGTGACRICTLPATTDYFSGDDNGAAGAGIIGATYRAEGWARTAPGAPVPGVATLRLRNFSYDGNVFIALENAESDGTTLDGNWKRFEATLTVTKLGMLNVYLVAEHKTDACFLLDDVVLQRVK
jgi:hypothetical protein